MNELVASNYWTQTYAMGPAPPLAQLGGFNSLENPRVDLNDPAVYDLLTDGPTSDAGVRVTRERAMHLPAVWAALALISGDVAKLPFDMYRKHPDGDRELLDAHLTHRLVSRKPNREMNAFKFWSRMMVYRLLFNNAYAFIVRNGNGSPAELLPLLPDRTAPERKNGRLIYVTEVNGDLKSFWPEQIFHLEGISVDNLQGADILKAARDAWGLALAQMKFTSKFFKNGGRTGGILELPSTMTKGSRDKVEEGFRKTYENNDEAFKTVILRDNAKFHEAQMSPEEAQTIEARRESVRDVARFFVMSPSKLGEESGVSYKSKTEDNRDYYDTTLSHHTAGIRAEANDKLLTPEEQADGCYFDHDTSALLQMDFKSMCESLNTLRSAEIINANEARAILNMNRRQDPGGDEFKNPNTKTDKNGSPAKKGDQGNEELAQAHRQLLAAALDRMMSSVSRRARKPCSSAKAFCAWLDKDFASVREPIRQAVQPIIQAHAAAAGADVAKTTGELVDVVMTDLSKLLNGVAESTSVSELYQNVERAVADFGQTRCLAIAEQFIK
jgi:HK97 family phage portal protein